MASREDDLHLAGGIAHLDDEGLNALPLVVILAWNLLAAGHDPLDAAEVDDHGRPLEAGHRAGDDGADAILELVVDAAALVLAQKLDHHLLDGLGADAAHRLQGKVLAAAIDADVAGIARHLHLELRGVLHVVLPAQTRGDRLLDVEEDGLLFDALVLGDVVDDANQLCVHLLCSELSIQLSQPIKKPPETRAAHVP